MQPTNIEWTEMSVNPFRARQIGIKRPSLPVLATGHYCIKVSAGCKNCYASAMQKRFKMPEFPEARRRDDIELFLDESKLMDVLRRKKPTKIFWCDMTDMFAEFYPDEWIDKCFAVMALTPQHTHQVLTKRPERMREYLSSIVRRREIHIAAQTIVGSRLTKLETENIESFPNVWLGVSIEDQKTADERIPLLLQTPAAVRWISAEPLLGPVDLRGKLCHWVKEEIFAPNTKVHRTSYFTPVPHSKRENLLDWVVVGGESGPHARPFNVQWARDIVAQCKAANVACFVKQLGSKPTVIQQGVAYTACGEIPFKDRKGGDPSEWPGDLRVREFPEVAG